MQSQPSPNSESGRLENVAYKVISTLLWVAISVRLGVGDDQANNGSGKAPAATVVGAADWVGVDSCGLGAEAPVATGAAAGADVVGAVTSGVVVEGGGVVVDAAIGVSDPEGCAVAVVGGVVSGNSAAASSETTPCASAMDAVADEFADARPEPLRPGNHNAPAAPTAPMATIAATAGASRFLVGCCSDDCDAATGACAAAGRRCAAEASKP